ncbi:MAG: hypothetical protein ABJZ55_13460 [Fuerstiella sp.]
MKLSDSLFITLTVVAQVLLMAATWPLWFCQTDYPQIALLADAANLPIWIDQAFSTALICGCVAVVFAHIKQGMSSNADKSAYWRTAAIWSCYWILVCSVASVVLDQHRLQPWHWLTMLLLAEYCLLNGQTFRKVAKVTLATIYLFAAASRFGPDVAAGMSGNVLKVVLQAVNLPELRPTDSRFFVLATIMNSVEFLIGFALLFQRTGRAAVIAAVLLHFILVTCLSPWGLNHRAGVLIWNLFLMLAIPTLFWNHNLPAATAANDTTTSAALSFQANQFVARLFMAAVVLIPASGLFGFADNWISWQVYSPRPEVLKLMVDENQIPCLPASLQPFVQPPQPLQSDCSIRLDRWSLHSKQVPIYPEDRFQIATAQWIVRQAVLQGAKPTDFKAELTFPSRFPWWKRSTINVSL